MSRKRITARAWIPISPAWGLGRMLPFFAPAGGDNVAIGLVVAVRNRVRWGGPFGARICERIYVVST